MGFGLPSIGSVGKAMDWAKDKATDAVHTAGNAVDEAGHKVVSGASSVVHTAGHAVHAVTSTASHVVNSGLHSASTVVHRAEHVASQAVDTGRRVVERTAQRATTLARDTAHVAANAWDIARTVATPGGFERKLKDLTAPAQDLRPGDSVAFNAGLDVNAAVSAGGHGEVTIAREPDGSYTVSGEVDGSLGGKITDSGLTFGAGAKVEFRADSAEQAREMAVTLMKAGTVTGLTATNPALAPLGGMYGPSHDELTQLKEHLGAVEFSGSAAASAGASVGLTPDLTGGAEVGAQGEQALRIEFEGGRPSAAVLRNTLQVDGMAGEGVAGLIPQSAVRPATDALGVDPRTLLAGGQAQVSITVEQRIALKPADVDAGNLLAALPGPAFGPVAPLGGAKLPGVAPDGKPQVSVTLAADATAAGTDRGYHGELSLSGVEPTQAAAVVKALGQGDVRSAAQASGVDVSYEYHGFSEKSDGPDVQIVVAEAQATRTITRTDASHTGGVQYGPEGATVWRSHDSVSQVRAGSPAAAALPYQPAFGSTPAQARQSPQAFEIQVGEELARGIGLSSGPDDAAGTAVVKELYAHQSRLPAADRIPEPELLHEPKINAGGTGGAAEPFSRPDWVVVQDPGKNPQVLAVEATLDTNFALNTNGGSATHKQLQVPGTIDALVNTFGEDRPIAYVIRAPREPGPQAQQSLDDVQRLLNSDPKYRNVTVTWVAG